MTFYGGGELTGPEYEGGTLLLMPTLTYDDWQVRDQQTTKVLIGAMRLAASIKLDRRLPYLSQAAAAVLGHIQKLQIDAAEALMGGASGKREGAAPERIARRLKAFPPRLRGQGQNGSPPGQPSIWELYGYDERVFTEMVGAADGVIGTLKHVPDIDFNSQLAEKLFQEFERIEFGDWRAQRAHEGEAGRQVDFGCDLKLLLTWLGFVGPVPCELAVDERFLGLKGDSSLRPEAVTAVVPTPAEKLPAEAYVEVVAAEARGTLKEMLKREDLSKIIARLEREHGSFDAVYLLRHVDDEGNLIQRWGDGGYAWMAHEDFRRCFRRGRAHVPAGVLDLNNTVPIKAAG